MTADDGRTPSLPGIVSAATEEETNIAVQQKFSGKKAPLT